MQGLAGAGERGEEPSRELSMIGARGLVWRSSSRRLLICACTRVRYVVPSLVRSNACVTQPVAASGLDISRPGEVKRCVQGFRSLADRIAQFYEIPTQFGTQDGDIRGVKLEE